MDAEFLQLWDSLTEEQKAIISTTIRTTSRTNNFRRNGFSIVVPATQEVQELFGKCSEVVVAISV